MYEQAYEWLATQFVGNEVFAGLIGASIIGSTALLFHTLPTALWRLAVRHLTVELTVHNTDVSFEWIRLWLARHPYGMRSRQLRLAARDDDSDGGHEWTVAPGEGLHLFLHRRRPIALQCTVDDRRSLGNNLKETFHIRALGRSQLFLRELVAEAVRIGSLDDRVAIFGWFGYWQLAARKRPRPVDSVILPDGLMELIVEDCARFLEAEDWYVEHGVPYRRGYLFSGPPGTGKSSVALCLASCFGRPLYTLNLSGIGNDSVLAETFADVPRNAILLLEDVDAFATALCRKSGDGGLKRESGPTLAGLLNAIDGVASSDGRLLIMTSNHPERLDPALVRPGRVDLKIRFRLFDTEDVRRMYLRFYPSQEANAARFAALIRNPVSPAELQSRLMTADPMGENRPETAAAVMI